MAKYVMLIDAERCTGCAACGIACQMQWQLTPDMNYNFLEFKETGSYPHARQKVLPVQCQHCDDPPCKTVCPTNATYQRDDGIVSIDFDKCIGCKYCMVACPYRVRKLNHDTGLPEKCKFCAEFVEEGEIPACVTTCMNGVRVFGDLEDPESEIARLIGRKRTHRLLERFGTEPSIYYVSS